MSVSNIVCSRVNIEVGLSNCLRGIRSENKVLTFLLIHLDILNEIVILNLVVFDHIYIPDV